MCFALAMTLTTSCGGHASSIACGGTFSSLHGSQGWPASWACRGDCRSVTPMHARLPHALLSQSLCRSGTAWVAHMWTDSLESSVPHGQSGAFRVLRWPSAILPLSAPAVGWTNEGFAMQTQWSLMHAEGVVGRGTRASGLPTPQARSTGEEERSHLFDLGRCTSYLIHTVCRRGTEYIYCSGSTEWQHNP